MRLKALTTPTVAKTVNKIANGENVNKKSIPGIPNLDNQILKPRSTIKLETADAKRRTLGDIAYPRSSAKPTINTGTADNINKVRSSALRSNTTDTGIKPKDNRGISPRMLNRSLNLQLLGQSLCVHFVLPLHQSQHDEKSHSHLT